MKKTAFLTGALLFALCLVPSMYAQNTCPADRAADKGYDPFGDFHHIMAPAWHVAWPDKDYDALMAAGPEFERTFEKIAEMKPNFKTEQREQKFLQLREEFASLVSKYAEAARQNDKQAVYDLMPDVHDAFEMCASSLLPIHYPEFEGVVITLNLIRESHLPAKNMDGIIGSTETLVTKMSALTEETIPAELMGVKADVVNRFAEIKSLVASMKECCDKKEMDQLSTEADKLHQLLDQFAKMYI